MKTLLIIFILFLSIGAHSQPTPESFVKSHLTITPDSTSLGSATDFTIYNVYFKDCKFVMVHRKKVPFRQAEEWEFYCILEEGRQIDISEISNGMKGELLNVWLKNR